MNKNKEKKKELTHFLGHYWIYAIILFYFTSLPQIYPTLITNDLHLHGTKMFPQFE